MCRYPWNVFINIRDRSLCGGSLVSPRHVLTAAHCVSDNRYIYATLSTLTKLSTHYLHQPRRPHPLPRGPPLRFLRRQRDSHQGKIRGSSTYGFIDDLKQMIYWPGWCVRDLCPPQLGRHRRHLLQLRRGPAHPGHRGGHVSYRYTSDTCPRSPTAPRCGRCVCPPPLTAATRARRPWPRAGASWAQGASPSSSWRSGEVLISTHYKQYLHTIYTGQGGGHLQPGVQGHLARGPGVS